MPLLYCSIPSWLPEDFRNQLRDAFEENARRNLRLTQELLEILDLLESQGIPAIPFKGPLLAYSVYGNLALRQFGDHDILIHKKDMLKAKGLLHSQGYTPIYSFTPVQEAVFLNTDCEYMLTHQNGRAPVELHWDFAPRYFSVDFNVERLWKRLESVSLGGKEILSFSAEDLLLILCVHGAKHRWNRFQWICDIAKLVNVRPDIDWNRVIQKANELGCERILTLALLLANNLLRATIPATIFGRIRKDRDVQLMADEVQGRLFQEAYMKPGISREFYAFQIKVRERLQDKLRYCVRLVVTPTLGDLLLIKLPGFLVFIYYPVRLIRLLIRQISRPLTGARNGM